MITVQRVAWFEPLVAAPGSSSALQVISTEKLEPHVTHQSSLSSIGTNLQHLRPNKVTVIPLTTFNLLPTYLFIFPWFFFKQWKKQERRKAGHTTSLETSTLLPALWQQLHLKRSLVTCSSQMNLSPTPSPPPKSMSEGHLRHLEVRRLHQTVTTLVQ